MRFGSLFAMLVLVGVSLAGCSDGGSSDPVEDAEFDDMGLEATKDTGIIRGVVVDASITPVPDALVRIESLGIETHSGESGAFGFDKVPPGPYFLDISKPGYGDVQQSIDVVANVPEPPIVKVLLEKDPSMAPFIEAYKFDGFIECSVRGVVIGFALCSATGVGNDRFLDEYMLGRTPDFIQGELDWESTQAAGDALSYSITCISGPPCPDGQVGIARDEGTAPLLLQVNRTTAEHFMLGAGQPVTLRVFAHGNEDTDLIPEDDIYQLMNDTAGIECIEWPVFFDSCMRFGGAGVVLQQEFTSYTHAFYNFVPREEWRFLTDGPHEVPE